MKIYRATIESWDNKPYGDEAINVEWEAFGADKKALKALQMAKALEIAPEPAWEFHPRWGNATVTVGERDYDAQCVSIELVC